MKDTKTVSIVINTYNRAAMLGETLKSLLYLDYPCFEVVVVNGPSTDNTEEILFQWKDKIKTGTCSEANLSVSRNIGIALASGEFVAFIDDDAIPEPEWLTQALEAFDSEEAGAAGGKVLNDTGYQHEYANCNRLGNTKCQMKETFPNYCFPYSFEFPYVQGTNAIFRRSALLEIGGFDEAYACYLDEIDVCLRLIDKGYVIRQLHNAFVHHKFALSHIPKTKTNNFWYPVLKSKVYFAKVHAPLYLRDKEIEENIQKFFQEQRDNVSYSIAHGLLPEESRVQFEEQAQRAWVNGCEEAKQAPKLITPDLLRIHRSEFKKFYTSTPGVMEANGNVIEPRGSLSPANVLSSQPPNTMPENLVQEYTIKEIRYIPTMRCNCDCIFCWVKKNPVEEVSAGQIAEAICRMSNIDENAHFNITGGGEPSLKEDLEDYVLPLLFHFPNANFLINTNGTLPERMERFVKTIPEKDKTRIIIVVSLDGPEQIHNRLRRNAHGYELATKTIKMLSENGIKTATNTVLFPETVPLLPEFEKDIKSLSIGGVAVSMNNSSCWADTPLGSPFPYTDKEVKTIFPHIRYQWDVKYLCSKGNFKLTNCHAGESNFLIYPNGNMYTCFAAACHRSDKREDFYLGNILEGVPDDLWRKRWKYGARENRKLCACIEHCAVEFEFAHFGYRYDFTEKEIDRFLEYSAENMYFKGFSAKENHQDGSWHRWTTSDESTIYVAQSDSRLLILGYTNALPDGLDGKPLVLTVNFNGKCLIENFLLNKSADELRFIVKPAEEKRQKITLKTNYLWQPSKVFGSSDNRKLGIAINNVKLIDYQYPDDGYLLGENQTGGYEYITDPIITDNGADSINMGNVVAELKKRSANHSFGERLK